MALPRFNAPELIGEGDEYELRGGPLYSLEDGLEAAIVSWRYVAFCALGVPAREAEDLALRRDVDRERVERMLVSGATPEQVLAIEL